MESEVMGLVDVMTVEDTGVTAGFRFWTGELAGRRVVVARCGMGKVSAAMGVQRLIDEWRVSCAVVCGLAGGLAPGLRVGDIVIGESFVQHDLDASPIYPRFQVPGLGIERFAATPALVASAEDSARGVAATLHTGEGRKLRISTAIIPSSHVKLVTLENAVTGWIYWIHDRQEV